jgi:hypothetical protein
MQKKGESLKIICRNLTIAPIANVSACIHTRSEYSGANTARIDTISSGKFIDDSSVDIAALPH